MTLKIPLHVFAFIVQNFCKQLIHILVDKTVFSVNNLHNINLDNDVVMCRCLLVWFWRGPGGEGRSFHIHI